jgi:hypothetical protein
MSLFSENGILYTIITVGIVFAVNMFGTRIKESISPESEENELVRKYLLNSSPLYGYNRPKLWIHTTYEYNARDWKSFGSRSSRDLNQPYIHLTVRSIVKHCSNDFNVCLIDDDSFNQLIPNWTVNVSELPEPSRQFYRDLAMCELLYIYGGMIVPNTFICLRNMVSLYHMGIQNNTPFVCETPNKCETLIRGQKWNQFTSNIRFMGATKQSPAIRELADYLQIRMQNPHHTNEPLFFGYTSKWVDHEVSRGGFTMIDGKYIGIKTVDNGTVELENLLSIEPINLYEKKYGVYIPGDNILKRTCYKWFSVMPAQELLKTNMTVTKYLLTALSDDEIQNPEPIKQDKYNERTVVSI